MITPLLHFSTVTTAPRVGYGDVTCILPRAPLVRRSVVSSSVSSGNKWESPTTHLLETEGDGRMYPVVVVDKCIRGIATVTGI